MATLRDAAVVVAEGQSIIAAWQESSLITQVFPLHETFALTQLQTSWVKNFFAPQPLGEWYWYIVSDMVCGAITRRNADDDYYDYVVRLVKHFTRSLNTHLPFVLLLQTILPNISE